MSALTLAVCLAAFSAPQASDNPPPIKLVAWKLGSQFNLAGVLSHRSSDPQATNKIYAKAKKLADLAGVEIPELPEKGELPKLLKFLDETNKSLAEKIGDKHGKEAGKLFDMASMTVVLLLVYEFDDKEMNQKFADGLSERGKENGLPEDLWKPVVSLVEKKGSFDDLKSAVLKMDDDVAEYLAKK